MKDELGVDVTDERIEELRQHFMFRSDSASRDVGLILDAQQAEIERLQTESQGRLALFRGSEESRSHHFQRAEQFKAALEVIAEGCGHARCHAYPWIRAARKALGV